MAEKEQKNHGFCGSTLECSDNKNLKYETIANNLLLWFIDVRKQTWSSINYLRY